MAKMNWEDSRIHDGVRDSKILWDSTKIDRKLDKYPTEKSRVLFHLNQGLRTEKCLVHGVDRDLPRESSGAEQHLQYISSNSRFDEMESWFSEYEEKESTSLGIYQINTKSESIIARFKRNLPVFDGFWHKEDLLSWIDDIEDFFTEINPPEHLKCKIVWYKMKGAAYYWWKQFQDDRTKHGKEEITSWPRMKSMVLKRFSPAMCSNKCPSQHDEKEKEKEGKQLVADDFTHNRCLTEVLVGAYVDKQDEISDLDAVYAVEEDVSKKTNGFQPLGSNSVAHLDTNKISESEEFQPKQRSVQSESIAYILELKHPSMEESQLKLLADLSTPTSEQSELGKVKEIVGSYLAQRSKFFKDEMVRKVATLLFDPGGSCYLSRTKYMSMSIEIAAELILFIITHAFNRRCDWKFDILRDKVAGEYLSILFLFVGDLLDRLKDHVKYLLRILAFCNKDGNSHVEHFDSVKDPKHKGSQKLNSEVVQASIFISHMLHKFGSEALVEGILLQPKFNNSCLKVIIEILGSLPKPDVNGVHRELGFQLRYQFYVDPFICRPTTGKYHVFVKHLFTFVDALLANRNIIHGVTINNLHPGTRILILVFELNGMEDGVFEVLCTSVDTCLGDDGISASLYRSIGTTSSDLHTPPFLAFDTCAQTLPLWGLEYLINTLYVADTVAFKICLNYWNFQSRSEHVRKPNRRVFVLASTDEMIVVAPHDFILAWKSIFGSDCTQLLATLKGHSQKTLALTVQAKGLFHNYKGVNIRVSDFENRQYGDFVTEYNSPSCLGLKVFVYASATTSLITARKAFIKPQLAHGFVSKFRGLSLNKKFILGTMCASCGEAETKEEGQDVVGLNPSKAWTWVFIKHLSGLSLTIFIEGQSNVTCYDDCLPYLTAANGNQDGRMDALFVVETYTQKIMLLFMQVFFVTRRMIVMFPFHPGANYICISDEHQEYYLFHNSLRSYYMGSWNGEDTSNIVWKFGMVKRSVITISSCLLYFVPLKLFHKVVNGLDPPKGFNSKPGVSMCWI